MYAAPGLIGVRHGACPWKLPLRDVRNVVLIGETVQVEVVPARIGAGHIGPVVELIDVRLKVEPWLETRNRSWAMHRTQMDPNNAMAQLPAEFQRKWRMYEYFQLAATRVGPDIAGENDLFARV